MDDYIFLIVIGFFYVYAFICCYYQGIKMEISIL